MWHEDDVQIVGEWQNMAVHSSDVVANQSDGLCNGSNLLLNCASYFLIVNLFSLDNYSGESFAGRNTTLAVLDSFRYISLPDIL